MSCRACGQTNRWCAAYTGCPLNKGNAHDLKPDGPVPSRNAATLKDFVAYCEARPELRFWQALLNWSGFGFILHTNATPTAINEAFKYRVVEDTYYREGK